MTISARTSRSCETRFNARISLPARFLADNAAVEDPAVNQKPILGCQSAQQSYTDYINKRLSGAQQMFGFGDKKAKLEGKYQQLLEDAYRLSHSNRRLSDQKHAEAEAVRLELEALEKVEP